MTTLPDSLGAPASLAGAMHEQTFNEALAEALRQRRRLWRSDPNYILAERLRMLADATRERPDILAAPPDIYPVVIEVEFGEPAFDDARRKLGRQVVGTPHPVRAAIAVGVPNEVSGWSPDYLKERLAQPAGVALRLAILYSGPTGTDDDASVWPEVGYVTGSVDDLAAMCEYASAPPALVSEMADRVAAQIHSLADYLHRSMPPGVAGAIATTLGQRDEMQGLRMACCIWLTSLRLHDLLAASSPSLQASGLRPIAAIRSTNSGPILLSDLRQEWDNILRVNYGSIFNTARTALDDRMPVESGAQALTRLAELADRITALRLGNQVNFAGELFPKLLDDREETAAHYTLPETAELLAKLAVSRVELPDWADAAAVANLRIADLACGTGTLLRAAYRHIRQRHEAAGGDAEDLHRTMMEQSITGLDINALASHMTAAGLSTSEIATEYHTARIASVAVLGGKTGSLELIEEEQITDITGQSVSSAAANGTAPTLIAVPHHSQDVVIQNPPYSRARGERALFDVGGSDDKQRRRSVKRLTHIRNALRSAGNEITDGQAGLGADFSALADRKLQDGGILATVLPLTAAHAESWEGFRRTIENEYRDITVIAFSANESAMMSADTYMAEMLLIASKRAGDDAGRDGVLCVNLNVPPVSVTATYWYANLIHGIDRAGRSSDVINVSANSRQRIGSWVNLITPQPGFPWFTVGMRNHNLATVVADLIEGRLYFPASRERWDFSLPATTLDRVVGIGPTHHLIGHIHGREAIGAFTFDSIAPGELPTYPSLWAADAERQHSILTLPTHEGQPAVNDEAQLRQILAQRSDLFISRNLRLTSQALAAARTEQLMMGGSSWTALLSDDDGTKWALAIWLNSTLGLMVRTFYSQTTQTGRARLQIRGLSSFPVPDFAADNDTGRQARAIARQHIGELAALQLRPASYAFQDANRRRVDSVALAMVGLGDNQQANAAIDALRQQWCREPSVHGGNRAIMRALGIE